MRILVGVALAALLSACQTPLPSALASCPWTSAKQHPPDQVLEVVRAGANPQPTLDEVAAAAARDNWAGSDGIWLSLPPDGRVTWGSPTLSSKFWAYAIVAGPASVIGRRLDAATPPGFSAVINGQPATSAQGPGFFPTGVLFPTNGCWEVTYRVGSAQLTFVVDVDRR